MYSKKQRFMHWFRRRSTIWLLCLVAFAMPLQAATASACQCVRNTALSTDRGTAQAEASPVMTHPSCCSPQPSCCSPRKRPIKTGCCGCCHHGKRSSPCGCGDGCRCSLLDPMTSPPALPPTPSSRTGEDQVKLQGLAVSAADCVVLALPSSSQLRASVECSSQTTLDLCATFCRMLL